MELVIDCLRVERARAEDAATFRLDAPGSEPFGSYPFEDGVQEYIGLYTLCSNLGAADDHRLQEIEYLKACAAGLAWAKNALPAELPVETARLVDLVRQLRRFPIQGDDGKR